MKIFFVPGLKFGLFAKVTQLSLSSQTVQQITGSIVSSPNKPAISFIRLINGINSLIEVDRAMYSLSVVLMVIYV